MSNKKLTFSAFTNRWADEMAASVVKVNKELITEYERMKAQLKTCEQRLAIAVECLEKVSDPRKRDHKEPDSYTQLGCVMHMATEALQKIKELE